MPEISLTDGDDRYVLPTDAGASIIHALAGNDIVTGGWNNTLFGDDSYDQPFGGAGDDRLVGGLGANLYDGGGGTDTAVLNGDARDYYLIVDTFYGVHYLVARNGSGNQEIRVGTELIGVTLVPISSRAPGARRISG